MPYQITVMPETFFKIGHYAKKFRKFRTPISIAFLRDNFLKKFRKKVENVLKRKIFIEKKSEFGNMATLYLNDEIIERKVRINLLQTFQFVRKFYGHSMTVIQ